PHVPSSESIPRRRSRARDLAIASALLFTASLFVPAIRLANIPFRESTPETYSGIQCLVYGWMVIFGWIANPFLLIAVILFAARVPRAALVFGCLAACAAATAPFAFVVWQIDLLRLDVGYWLWLASIVAFSLAAWDARRSRTARA
ncbi:MAG TPA: hypothetical protein VGO00_06105, partial [Kofleriaceae bacterium]|nr:hypothetical protein [Kofleriaceae bacterium]